ncbi:hypothetical protein F66182_6572 [Fusarium sp. NRRL 66182]|nr:hypothetical protein F66182_6572 [Fusarium sp. NRRL 66182]
MAPIRRIKVYMPVSSDPTAGHEVFGIYIRKLSLWQEKLKPKRRGNTVAKKCQETGATTGRWTITNGSFEVDKEKDLPSPGFPVVDVPSPTKTASSSGSNTPCFTIDEWARIDQMSGLDADVLHQRLMTELILEGKITPTPDRNYEGSYASIFHDMAIQEARDAQRNALQASARVPPLHDDSVQGWRFLHGILSLATPLSNGKPFPAYHPNQRAYLHTRDKKNGRMVTTCIRNLDACSKAELLKLINLIEERGWQDMIYVANQGEDIPNNLQQDDEAQPLYWYG